MGYTKWVDPVWAPQNVLRGTTGVFFSDQSSEEGRYYGDVPFNVTVGNTTMTLSAVRASTTWR